jgi:hypothetical protein
MSDTRRKATAPIDKSKIKSVYSGRHGCCCGCNGNHRYASAFAEELSKERGYPVDVSDRSVSIIVNKMNRIIAAGNEPPEDIEMWDDKEIFQVFEAPGLGEGARLWTYTTEERIIIAYNY